MVSRLSITGRFALQEHTPLLPKIFLYTTTSQLEDVLSVSLHKEGLSSVHREEGLSSVHREEGLSSVHQGEELS